MEIEKQNSERSSIDEMFRQSLKYKGSDEFKKFFGFISKFHHYSRYNSMLVYIQNPAVTFFGSPWYWKTKFSRRINPDGKPLIILAPNGPIILAYDVFDTIGKQTPEQFLEEGLKTKMFDVQGEFKDKYLEGLKYFASRFNIKVQIKPLNYFNAGAVTTYITKKLEIYLREGHSPAQHFATLCHELAHILLGHTGHKELLNAEKQKRIKLPERKHLTQAQEELEAETVNFLVCKRLGLETQSLEYLAGYLKEEKDWENFSYDTVIKVADRLEALTS